MGDAVQAQLEDMVPELDDLRTLGLFSDAELRAIVERRKGFEFALQRRKARLRDSLQYLSFELRTDALRAKRKERLGVRGSSVSDYSMARRVHFIFTRALRKFPGDLRLWAQYIDYAKRTHSTRRLGRLFPSALRLHPRVEALWIEAACWEMVDNGNPAGARVLLQRALRINKGSAPLWREYLRLELLYAQEQGSSPAVALTVLRHAPGALKPELGALVVATVSDTATLQAFEEALTTDCGLGVRGALLVKLRGVAAAVAALEAEARADPRLWGEVVEFLRAHGQHERQMAAFASATATEGAMTPGLYAAFVQALMEDGDAEGRARALATAAVATEEFPEEEQLWALQADLVGAEGAEAEAIEVLREAVASCPGAEALWARLWSMQLALGVPFDEVPKLEQRVQMAGLRERMEVASTFVFSQ